MILGFSSPLTDVADKKCPVTLYSAVGHLTVLFWLTLDHCIQERVKSGLQRVKNGVSEWKTKICLTFFLVFGMLLGDTLILDNLDYANSYRQEVRVCVKQV